MKPNSTKKCIHCSRYFRGDGYKDVCTESCFMKREYSVTHNIPVKLDPIYKKQNTYSDSIKKANERWLNKKEPKPRTQKQKAWMSYVMNTQHTRASEWSGKQYMSVRG